MPAPHLDLDVLRHSTAHLMAAAVCELFPGAEYGIGPSIEDGFYYDFLLPGGERFTEEDLPRIEERMREIQTRHPAYERSELTRDKALVEFRERSQRFKVELIERIPADEVISCYRTGDFFDLCRGPHVPEAGQIPAFKLLHPAGAYWHGDESQPMLQRIYGTAWSSQAELDLYLERLEMARQRDHRRVGRELDLFSLSEELGGGLVLWHPNGATVRTVIEDYWRQEHRSHGYKLVYTPHVAREQLWETSGHLGFFADEMYGPMEVEGDRYRIKPMSCPFHILIFQSRQRSYRELPLRLAELASVYRFQRSGTLHGLLRVRGFTQDDAHIFCTPEQAEAEVAGVLDMVQEMMARFGFLEVEIDLSTKPAKAAGEDAMWEAAEAALDRAVRSRGLDFQLNQGEGAFYGPKVDVHIRDAMGRRWQCATVQFDFNEPERFGLEYIGADGAAHRPLMVHRTLLGSMERFFGVLLEHYAGALPTWLSPVQVQLLTITDDQLDYAHQVVSQLEAAGFRAEVADRPGRQLNAKIREGQLAKIPYLAVVGKREVEAGAVNLRDTRGGDQQSVTVAQLLEKLRAETAPS
ncbi:MAG TPA: threonine--tRNA ligase [Candidatus Dormibacteraeota bacterium]|nr:threonine--tRNA ligase [Candidatus Dormibacteraeota bacterium]